jgi:BirA family transcriptional regulator, biotin operon repressor / biotin---[acetyl-CoA-carboxylase] ligase
LYKIPANTLFMGKNLVFVPECHSTNTLAHEMSQHSAITDGTVIVTDHQIAGRGQRGNSWESEAGKNLTFSLILKPTFLPVHEQFYLNIFASLAIHDLLKDKTDATIRIKWPNDILINGKKVCGILIENQIQGPQVSNTVIGIGINVNQLTFTLSSATSLAIETGLVHDTSVLLDQLLGLLERRYLQLRESKYNAMRSAYISQLYWIDEHRLFASSGTSFEGKITGIDASGRLKLLTPEGERAFNIKELSYLA